MSKHPNMSRKGSGPRFNFPYLNDPELDELKRFKKIHIDNSRPTKGE